MSYLIMAAIFVSIGIGLAIWVARERKAKHKAQSDLKDAMSTAEEYRKIADNNGTTVERLEKELAKTEALVKDLKTSLEEVREKLVRTLSIDEIKEMLDEDLSEELV